MTVSALIPARLNSSRLEKKLIKDLDGIPVIVRTYKNIVSTKTFKNKYFAFFNIDFSPPEDPSLPPTPSAIVGITPEKVSSMF